MPINESVFEHFPTMETDRLVLGPFEPADAPETFRFYSSEESLRLIPRDFFVDPQEGVEKLGFQKEGVLRDNAFARERYWDHCLFARLGE